jgi:hypothetical protein
MLNFVGRSLDGRRTAVKLLGCRVESSGDDFRVTTAEGSMVNAAVAALNAMEGTFVTINGFQPVWKNYANIGDNAYWRNHIR